jgi:hypothetical protein
MWKYFSVPCSSKFETTLRCLKVRRLRPLVLLIWVAFWWRWVWSISETILTRGTRKYWVINLSHCHFSDHTFHWPGVEHGSRRWEVDNEPPEPLWPHLKAEICVRYVWRYIRYLAKNTAFFEYIETAIDQQQHSCETLICQRHQTILRPLSSAATASTRWRVRELYCQSTYASPVISYKEVIDVYRNNSVDHTHTSCGQNTEFLNVTSRGTYNDLWALKGKYRNVISDWIAIFAISTFPISAVSDIISSCSVVRVIWRCE